MCRLQARHQAMSFVLVMTGVLATAAAGCRDPRRAESSVAATDTTGREVALRWIGPGGAAIAVPVRINGAEPVDLILDTGATLTCVDTALARELALPAEQGLLGGAIGAGGTGRVDLHTVDSLQIGGAVIRGLTVCSIALDPLREVDDEVRGLLGLNALRGFRVTLDFERDVVRLGPADE